MKDAREEDPLPARGRLRGTERRGTTGDDPAPDVLQPALHCAVHAALRPCALELELPPRAELRAPAVAATLGLHSRRCAYRYSSCRARASRGRARAGRRSGSPAACPCEHCVRWFVSVRRGRIGRGPCTSTAPPPPQHDVSNVWCPGRRYPARVDPKQQSRLKIEKQQRQALRLEVAL